MVDRRTVWLLVLLLGLPVSLQGGDLEELAISAQVNHLLEDSWKDAGVEPAPLTDDSTFLRRAYLDLTGVIPTVGETRVFLASERPDKRRQLVRSLLKKPAHYTHLATLWQKGLIPADNNNRFFNNQGFAGWLRNHFSKNTPYNEMTFELLTYKSLLQQRTQAGYQQNNAALFYTSTQLKPEVLAARTSRFFLGVQTECAQCHDHPFDRWKQKDFWGFAAFYAQIKRSNNRRTTLQINDADKGEVMLPDTKDVVPPRFLGGKIAEKSKLRTRREQLAVWLTADENPYFAKATVNRVWAMLFGYGLVTPLDDFGDHNPCSQPKVLELLANDFVNNHYDLKRLIRILAFTKAYQLSSKTNLTGDIPKPQLFSRMTIKSLSAEQLYDCLETASCKKESVTSTNGRFVNRFGNNQKRVFLNKFGSMGSKTTEYQSGIPQALTLMNGAVVSDLTNPAKSDLLIALSDSPFMDDAERVEILFLATLSRFPKKEEREKLSTYIKQGSKSDDSKQALGDVLWALLNSTEFQLNH